MRFADRLLATLGRPVLFIGIASLVLVLRQANPPTLAAHRAVAPIAAMPSFRAFMAAAEKQANLESKPYASGMSPAIATIAEMYFTENECLQVNNLPFVTRYEILERQSAICCPVRVLRGSERDKALRLMKKFG